MARRIPYKPHPDQDEYKRYYCQYCGFLCYEGRDVEGDYGSGGWDFSSGATSGSDLISNGAFTALTTGWTAVNGTIAITAGGQSGNCCTLTRSSGDAQYLYQALSALNNADITFGQTYRLRAYVKSGTSGAEAFALRIYSPDRDMIKYSKTGTTTSTWTQYTLYWRAFHGNNNISLVKNSSTAGTMLFDTVDVYAYDFKVNETTPACPLCNSKAWKK